MSARARAAIEDEDTELFISAASVWEMAIKAGLGRLELPAPVSAYVADKARSGYQFLPVTWADAAAVQGLPMHHRDPYSESARWRSRFSSASLFT